MKFLLVLVTAIVFFTADGRDFRDEPAEYVATTDQAELFSDKAQVQGWTQYSPNGPTQDQQFEKQRKQHERKSKKPKCKRSDVCGVVGGVCVTNATLCSGRLVPEGCKGLNCQCCVPGTIEAKINNFEKKLNLFNENLNKTDINLQSEFKSLKDNLSSELHTLNTNRNKTDTNLQSEFKSLKDNLNSDLHILNTNRNKTDTNLQSEFRSLKDNLNSELQTLNANRNKTDTNLQSEFQSLKDNINSELQTLSVNRNKTDTNLQSNFQSLKDKLNSELQTLKEKINSELQSLNKNSNISNSDLSADFLSLKGNINSEMHSLKQNMNTGMQSLKQNVNSVMQSLRNNVNSGLSNLTSKIGRLTAVKGTLIFPTKTTVRLNWLDALKRCQDLGAEPFIPRTSQDVHLINTINGEVGSLWLPVSDHSQEGTLRWWNGQDATSSSRSWPWLRGSYMLNNHADRDCLLYGSSGGSKGYFMYACSHKSLPMICRHI